MMQKLKVKYQKMKEDNRSMSSGQPQGTYTPKAGVSLGIISPPPPRPKFQIHMFWGSFRVLVAFSGF